MEEISEHEREIIQLYSELSNCDKKLIISFYEALSKGIQPNLAYLLEFVS